MLQQLHAKKCARFASSMLHSACDAERPKGRGKRTVNPFSKVGVCAAEDGDSEVVAAEILSAQEFFFRQMVQHYAYAYVDAGDGKLGLYLSTRWLCDGPHWLALP
jgi:hypothetical protein